MRFETDNSPLKRSSSTKQWVAEAARSRRQPIVANGHNVTASRYIAEPYWSQAFPLWTIKDSVATLLLSFRLVELPGVTDRVHRIAAIASVSVCREAREMVR